MRSLILITLLLITACQTVSVAQHPPAPDVEMAGRHGEFMAFFRKAFFSDGEAPGDPEISLFRRTKPIIVSFPEGEYGIRPYVEDYMKMAKALTGVSYSFGPPPPAYVRVGDLVVHIVPLDEVRAATNRENQRNSVNCFARPYHGKNRGDGILQAAEVWLPRDLPGEHQHCVSEEFSHAFGLTGDSYLGTTSAFSYNWPPADHRLTEWDRAALWLLYHPDLKPGMMWDEAEPIVRRIMKETWGWF